MPSIHFAAQETTDSRHYVVAFPALINGTQVGCANSYQALWQHFGADYDDPLPAFRRHRPHIEQLAVQFIRQQRFGLDGTILIRNYDLA
jgi:hypothetical protein